VRNEEGGDSAYENKFLLFYLSDRPRVYTSIFGDKENKLSLKYKLEFFINKSNKNELTDFHYKELSKSTRNSFNNSFIDVSVN
jgi:hypothetical protein